MTTFSIPYPQTKRGKSAFCRRFDLNAYYAGKHWAQRKKDAEEIHLLAWAAMRRAGAEGPLADFPVEVRFYWDDGLDADNHAALGKMIVDAMRGVLIRDDSRGFVRRVSHEFWDGGEILVEVRAYAPGENG